jgi:outer membrane biosynthesis protein TonB
MNNFFDLIDKYKFGVVGAFAAGIGLFMYLELTSVPEYKEIHPFFEDVAMENVPEEQKLEITKDNLEIQDQPKFEAGKVTNTVRDANDTRERSNDNWSASKSYSDIEKSIKDDERKMFEETGGEAKRKAIREQDEERKKSQSQNKNDKSSAPKSNNGATSGTNNAVKGNVMVEWSLSGRSPHQNNEWNVRNPGYTCGHGSSGRVVIQIKVGQDGRVVSAIPDAAGSSSANPCMIEQAVKYAKLSRFDYSASEVSQTGKIFYTFISQ